MTYNPLVSMHTYNLSTLPDNYRRVVERFNAHATAFLSFVCGDSLTDTFPMTPAGGFIEALNGYCIILKSGDDNQIAYMRQKVCFLAGAAGGSHLQFWNVNEYLDTYTDLAVAAQSHVA